MASFVLVNVVIAQAIIRAFYPQSGLQLGTAAFVASAVIAIGGLILVVRSWRAFLSKQRARPRARPNA